jgi:hypothetical protein
LLHPKAIEVIMSYLLCAGVVSDPPKENPFPRDGRPYSSVNIDVDDVIYHVRAHDDEMPTVSALMVGDAVSVQGKLVLVTEKGRLSGFYIVASSHRCASDQQTECRSGACQLR